MSVEQRLRNCCGTLYDTPQTFTIDNFSLYVSQHSTLADRRLGAYLQDFKHILTSVGASPEYLYLLHPGDIAHDTKHGVFAIAKPVGTSGNLLLNIDVDRHWGCVSAIDQYDIPFTQKSNRLLWRGVTTGWGHREPLVKNFYACRDRDIDIGYTAVVQNRHELAAYCKPPQSIPEMLRSRYLISVQGNDVASNSKWTLYSNSCVIMPPPTIVSWLSETALKPYVHYVPVSQTFSDLPTAFAWCKQHPERAASIAAAGRAYISAFFDAERERQIAAAVIACFTKNVRYRISVGADITPLGCTWTQLAQMKNVDLYLP